MPVFDQLQRASFDGQPFPVESVDVTGDLRHHVHEYPHTPGGDPEKLGRGLYRIQMLGNFQATFRGYPKLWPDGLARLRKAYEDEKTSDLVIPTIGTIKAFITKWRQRSVAKTRSGEKVELEFLEDQADAFLVSKQIAVHVDSLVSSAATIKKEIATFGSPPSLFDAIQSAANAAIAYLDTAEMAGNLLEAKLRQLQRLCGEADRLDLLQDPVNYQLLDALHSIWTSVNEVADNLQGKPGGLETYTVPMTMPVSEISRALYGDATHAVDILQLNPIEDAFRVLAGTPVRYYPAAV